MMDLQQDRSLFRKLMEAGIELYVIDWGYPTKIDRYLTMEDYILGYMDNIVDFVRERTGNEKINILGVCQGGTFSLIYSALFQEKVKNLVLMVAPVDFDTRDGLLNIWSKVMDADLMVDVMGNIPGEFMNLGFLWLKPFQLILDKYVGLIDNIDNPEIMQNFLRMEKWIFDSPDQAGESVRKFIKDLYQENKLVKNELLLGGRKVDLKQITIPILNIYGEQDHLVPPHCSRCVDKIVASKDITTKAFPLGHIGMYVSSRSQKELAPMITQWLIKRSIAPSQTRRAAKPESVASRVKPKTVRKRTNRDTNKKN
jgi:polyhydroxyalkanoate synthase